MPVKTDRRDAEGIARLLRMGWFRPVHCKSVSAQELRALLSTRPALQKAVLDIEQSLRGVLRNFGLTLGPISKGRYEERVRELVSGNIMLEAASQAVLGARDRLRYELAGVERQLRDLARQDHACRLMMTMPGVGALVALTVRAAIDDPSRFRSSRAVGPWAGLTPRREQSGERVIVGHITKAGAAANGVVQRGDRAASREALLAKGLGNAGRKTTRAKASDGHSRASDRGDPAPHVGGWRRLSNGS